MAAERRGSWRGLAAPKAPPLLFEVDGWMAGFNTGCSGRTSIGPMRETRIFAPAPRNLHVHPAALLHCAAPQLDIGVQHSV